MNGVHIGKTLHLVIHGRVQGVFFRDSMRREAQRCGVAGWVRNRGDGTVEAMVQGGADAVESMLDWARHGSSQARVDRVEVTQGTGSYASFDVLA